MGAGAHQAGEAWAQTIVTVAAHADAAGWSEGDLRRLWVAYDQATELFSGRYRGSGRPFVCHLAGTADLCLAHGGTPDEVIAALLHAAYPQGDFGTGAIGVTPAKRRRLRAVVGERAERLIAFYAETDTPSWAETARKRSANSFSEDERSVLLIRLVNEIDDALDLAVYPAERAEQNRAWLKPAAQLAGRMGKPALEEELRAALARAEHAPGTAPGANRRSGSYRLLAPSVRPRLFSLISGFIRYRLPRP